LQELTLYDNSLVGSIPSILGHLKNLNILNLHSNKLEGNIQLHLLCNLLIYLLSIEESSYLFCVLIQL